MTKECPNSQESSFGRRHNDDVKNHERLEFSRRLSLLSHVAQLVTLLFTCFALCGLPFFYTRRIASITPYSDSEEHKDEHKHLHTTKQWRSILRTVIRLCYSAMGTGCFTICVGAWIIQHSFEPSPAILGHIAMILGADASINAFIIYLYIDLIAKYTNISDVKVDRVSVIARIARVFAVPASSLIWCLSMTVATTFSYLHQGTTLREHSIYSPDRSSTSTSYTSPTTITAHFFALHATSCVLLVAGCCIIRTILGLRSILSLREVDRPTVKPVNPSSDAVYQSPQNTPKLEDSNLG